MKSVDKFARENPDTLARLCANYSKRFGRIGKIISAIFCEVAANETHRYTAVALIKAPESGRQSTVIFEDK